MKRTGQSIEFFAKSANDLAAFLNAVYKSSCRSIDKFSTTAASTKLTEVFRSETRRQLFCTLCLHGLDKIYTRKSNITKLFILECAEFQ